jgi:hypothetical protein
MKIITSKTVGITPMMQPITTFIKIPVTIPKATNPKNGEKNRNHHSNFAKKILNTFSSPKNRVNKKLDQWKGRHLNCVARRINHITKTTNSGIENAIPI